MNDLGRFLHHKFRDRPDRWVPFLAVYYLTYACDFRCPYCSDGQGKPYHAQASGHLPGDRVVELFGRIRKVCSHLEITGGEPLKHPDIDAILRALPTLGFGETVLTTNGWALEEHIEAVSVGISTLVVSLDTLDPDLAARWYGKGPGTLAHLLRALEMASSLPRTKLIVSAVATVDNLQGLREVCAHAQALGASFACYPQLEGVRVPDALARHPLYRPFFQWLLDEKRRGARIWSTPKAIEWMRDLPKIPCRPFTLLAVQPDGSVFYPCLEKGTRAGNLFDEPNLHVLRQRGQALHGPQPLCPTQCHSACSLGFSSILEHPATMLDEAVCQTRGLVSRILS